MLTVSLAGFLIAKLGGFLQLACWVLHPFHFWPACLLLGLSFLIMRLLTANSLCLSCLGFFFPQGEAKIKTTFCIWLPLVFVCHDINYTLVLHCLATNCLQYVINSNQGLLLGFCLSCCCWINRESMKWKRTLLLHQNRVCLQKSAQICP